MVDGRIRIANNTQPWFGFTLQRGHAYGLYLGVCYVSGAEPDPSKAGNIIVYRQKKDKDNVDYYRWSRTSISACCQLGRLIMAAISESPYGCVTFRPEEIKMEVWQPYFPTYRKRRPDAMPRLPRQRIRKTWVDQIVKEACVR